MINRELHDMWKNFFRNLKKNGETVKMARTVEGIADYIDNVGFPEIEEGVFTEEGVKYMLRNDSIAHEGTEIACSSLDNLTDPACDRKGLATLAEAIGKSDRHTSRIIKKEDGPPHKWFGKHLVWCVNSVEYWRENH